MKMMRDKWPSTEVSKNTEAGMKYHFTINSYWPWIGHTTRILLTIVTSSAIPATEKYWI